MDLAPTGITVYWAASRRSHITRLRNIMKRFHAIVASKQIPEETSMSHKDSAFFAPRFIMVFSILNALC